MNQYSHAFHTFPILKVIPPNQLDLFLSQGIILIKSYAANEIIHFDGDQCKRMEIILTGDVTVERIDEDGHLMTVAAFSAGNCLGANLLFSSNPYFPMTVSAKSRVSILSMKEGAVFNLCITNEDFLKQFLQVISDHTILLGAKIKHYVNRSIREILTAYLIHESISQKGPHIHLKTSKKALAERMGVQRTSLSRELQKMKKEGLIDFDAVSITILDQTILK